MIVEYIKFGELYEIPSCNGVSRPSAVRGQGFHMINMGELFSNDIINEMDMDRVKLSETEQSKFFVKKNDLLFARQSLVASGAGKCSIINNIKEPTTFESHLIRVRLKQSCNSWFYYYLFQLPSNPVKTIVNQCAQAGIRGSELSKIKVPFPDLATQNKIASILSAYDDLIEKNNRRMELLRGCAEELYKEWFVRFRFPNWQNTKFINGIPQGWGYGKIGDLCKIKNGFAFSSSDFLDKGDFGIIKIENVLFGDIQINKCQYVSDIDENKLKSFRLHSNDILIAMTGAQIGKTGRFPVVDKIFYLNQRVGKFIPNNPNIVNNHYLYQYTQTKSFITFIENYANGAAQPNISGKQIENIKILIPTNKLLQEYELRVDNILNSIQLLKNQNELLKQQRDLLLPRLMSGKINVTP